MWGEVCWACCLTTCEPGGVSRHQGWCLLRLLTLLQLLTWAVLQQSCVSTWGDVSVGVPCLETWRNVLVAFAVLGVVGALPQRWRSLVGQWWW